MTPANHTEDFSGFPCMLSWLFQDLEGIVTAYSCITCKGHSLALSLNQILKVLKLRVTLHGLGMWLSWKGAC